jgi:hypothetical protein
MVLLLVAVVPSTPVWQLALFACNLLAFVALFARVLSMRLAKTYPALTLWLAFNIASSAAPWFVQMSVWAYAWFYLWAEASSALLYLFVVIELYGKVFNDHPGVAGAMKRLIIAVAPVSAFISALLLRMERPPLSYLDWLYQMEQGVISCLALLVLMASGFMVWFPLRVARNTVVYSVGYATYLVPKGATLLLMNLGQVDTKLSGAICMTVCALCLLFWALFLSESGETAMVSLSRPLRVPDERRLMAQLELINRSLSRVAGK